MTPILKNNPFEELTVGMEAEMRRLCRQDDMFVFAHGAGNLGGPRGGHPHRERRSGGAGSGCPD